MGLGIRALWMPTGQMGGSSSEVIPVTCGQAFCWSPES